MPYFKEKESQTSDLHHGIGMVCCTYPFKYFSICSTNNNRFQLYLVLIGPYLYWRERGWAWSQISRHEENVQFYNYLLLIPLWLNPFPIMKKSAKNCTLYHVVNKSVWTDIGATLCGRSGMFIPDPRSWFLPIPDHGSRITDLGSRIQKQPQISQNCTLL